MPVLFWMRDNNYVIPFACVALYLLFIHYGQKYMETRNPFGLNNSLAAWNLLLSLFSTYGAIRTVPHMFYLLSSRSFEETVCEECYRTYGGGASGFATQLFILSKIPELIDTVFIVLRKKPLIFLHWYHHVTVLLFCWNAYVTMASNGLYFVSMNYTVHAVMYFYYYLQAVKKIPKWFPSWIITLMQISQMMIGTFIVGATTYYYFFGGKIFGPKECSAQPSSIATGFIIYASYLYLFVEFAVRRFILKERDPESAGKKITSKLL
jgi:elongation of very long chain fatty acids protein 6